MSSALLPYAGILGLLFIALTFRVILIRNNSKITLGAEGNEVLGRWIRVHANFAEFIPLALLLVFLAEQNGYSSWAVHLSGIALIAGRVLHAIAVSNPNEVIAIRAAGVMLTLITIVSASIFAIMGGLFG